MSDELAALDATAQAALVTRRELSARELVDAAIERLERRNPELNAVIHSYLDLARERADAVEPGSAPFAGVPMLMKDIGGAEAGQPNHAGMAALKRAGYREPADSYFTQRVRAAGLLSLGRTNKPELAILPVAEPDAYGATR
ncbi:MAG: amidase family protein, partial [Myxococcales bacterium]|nr:amidase family protein [Myxococcales bacterium]